MCIILDELCDQYDASRVHFPRTFSLAPNFDPGTQVSWVFFFQLRPMLGRTRDLLMVTWSTVERGWRHAAVVHTHVSVGIRPQRPAANPLAVYSALTCGNCERVRLHISHGAGLNQVYCYLMLVITNSG